MSQEWMIDVLVDLRNFCQKNGLETLSEHLEDTIHIAAEQIAELAKASEGRGPNDGKSGSVHRTYQLV